MKIIAHGETVTNSRTKKNRIQKSFGEKRFPVSSTCKTFLYRFKQKWERFQRSTSEIDYISSHLAFSPSFNMKKSHTYIQQNVNTRTHSVITTKKHKMKHDSLDSASEPVRQAIANIRVALARWLRPNRRCGV